MPATVLPLVDTHRGLVQFSLQGRWQTYYTSEPLRLVKLLGRCAARPSFEQSTQTLLLSLPHRGSQAGRSLSFSLAKFPGQGPITRLEADGEPGAEPRADRLPLLSQAGHQY